MKRALFIILTTLLSLSCEKEKVTPSTTSISNNDTSVVSNTLAKVDFFGVYMFKSGYYDGEKINDSKVYFKYLGGNGKKYSSQKINSLGLQGLTLTLEEGYVKKEDSIIVGSISGTPLKAGKYSFIISLGGQTTGFDFEILKKETSTEKVLLLTTYSWRISSRSYSNDTLKSIDQPIEECEKDDRIKFNTDATLFQTFETSLCEGQKSGDSNKFYWRFDALQENLAIKEEGDSEYSDFKVLKLDAYSLIIESILIEGGIRHRIVNSYQH
jgi:hypothetical protein